MKISIAIRWQMFLILCEQIVHFWANAFTAFKRLLQHIKKYKHLHEPCPASYVLWWTQSKGKKLTEATVYTISVVPKVLDHPRFSSPPSLQRGRRRWQHTVDVTAETMVSPQLLLGPGARNGWRTISIANVFQLLQVIPQSIQCTYLDLHHLLIW